MNTTPRQNLMFFLCFNDNYALQAGVTVTSLLENNHNITIHLFMVDVSDANKKLYREFNRYRCNIISYDINPKLLSQQSGLKYRHISICLRLFIPKLLKNENILIYLDIICLSSLEPLLAIDFNDNIAIVVKDTELLQQIRCPLFDIPYGKYFNTGMMVINTANWNKNDITNKTINLLKFRRKEFNSIDQDALNISLKGKTLFVQENYNKIMESVDHKLTTEITSQDIFLHFAGPVKPWFSDTIPPVYHTYLSLSPWKSVKLKISVKEKPSIYRLQAKDALNQKNIVFAIKYSGIYLFKKINSVLSIK